MSSRRGHSGSGRLGLTRRALLGLMALPAGVAFGQGISSRGVRPQPRGKPSGRPFLEQFTDVAAKAGLTHPVVYGGVDAKGLGPGDQVRVKVTEADPERRTVIFSRVA